MYVSNDDINPLAQVILTGETGEMRMQMQLVQLRGVRQLQRERERGVVRAEEVVGPGGRAHAPRRARAARVRAAAAAQQHVRRLRRRVAARHRACTRHQHSQYLLHEPRAVPYRDPIAIINYVCLRSW